MSLFALHYCTPFGGAETPRSLNAFYTTIVCVGYEPLHQVSVGEQQVVYES